MASPEAHTASAIAAPHGCAKTTRPAPQREDAAGWGDAPAGFDRRSHADKNPSDDPVRSNGAVGQGARAVTCAVGDVPTARHVVLCAAEAAAAGPLPRGSAVTETSAPNAMAAQAERTPPQGVRDATWREEPAGRGAPPRGAAGRNAPARPRKPASASGRSAWRHTAAALGPLRAVALPARSKPVAVSTSKHVKPQGVRPW